MAISQRIVACILGNANIKIELKSRRAGIAGFACAVGAVKGAAVVGVGALYTVEGVEHTIEAQVDVAVRSELGSVVHFKLADIGFSADEFCLRVCKE